MAEYNRQKKYPDPVIAKVKGAKVIKPVMPENLPDTNTPVILENTITAPTEQNQITEQNLI